MNKARRKTIAKSLDTLQTTLPVLESLLEEEKNALEAIPDDEEHDEQRDSMGALINNLEEAISSLRESIDALEGADF